MGPRNIKQCPEKSKVVVAFSDFFSATTTEAAWAAGEKKRFLPFCVFCRVGKGKTAQICRVSQLEHAEFRYGIQKIVTLGIFHILVNSPNKPTCVLLLVKRNKNSSPKSRQRVPSSGGDVVSIVAPMHGSCGCPSRACSKLSFLDRDVAHLTK